VSASPGDVVAYNSVSGKFVQHDTAGSLFPIGVRGNSNNLVQNGEYVFPGASGFSAGDEVYADPLIDGALTALVNDRFIGTFVSSTRLVVNMNAIALSATTVAPGVTFPIGLFSGALAPGETAAWGKFGTWEPWSYVNVFHGPVPEGIRGNSNNIITNGLFVPGGSPYISQTRYFADLATPGLLTTVKNEIFVGKGIGPDSLLVNMTGAQVWEDASSIVGAEHDTLTGTHDEGSARAWVGAEAGRSARSNSLASSTGMLYYASDTGRVWYCSNGAANVWIEQTHFTGLVTIDNSLLVSSQIRMPAKALHDNISDLMNPFAHAARHLVGGLDPLSGVVNQLITTGSSVDFGLVQAAAWPVPDQSILSVGFDFTGRPGNSTVLFFAPVSLLQNSAGVADISLAFFLDAVEVTTPNSIRGICEVNPHASSEGGQTMTLVGWSSTVSAAAHTLAVYVGVRQATTPVAQHRTILALDLGLT